MPAYRSKFAHKDEPGSGAIFGVVLAVTTPWEDWSSKHINADLFARMDAGLAHPENGLRL
jgi:hypothetical protein